MACRTRLLLAVCLGAISVGGGASALPASTIRVDINAGVTVVRPTPSAVDSFNTFNESGAAVTAPTAYSEMAVNNGASNSSTLVSLGHLHSSQVSTFPLDGSTGDAQGYVDINVADFGLAPSTSLTGLLAVNGLLSPTDPFGTTFSDAVVHFNLIDLDNGDSATNILRMQYNTTNPALNVLGGVLTTHVGDRIELAYTFNIEAYQAGNAPALTAFADFSHTANFYVDSGLPGADFLSQTGYDYASPLAVSGVPEPADWLLMIAGLSGIGAAMRVRPGYRSAPQSCAMAAG